MRRIVPRSCLAMVLAAGLAGSAPAEPVYPQLANIYLHGFADTDNAAALARWDLLVLDPVWSEAQLSQLRALNPHIRIFFYVCSYCADWPADAHDPWQEAGTQYAADHDLWWYDRNMQPASDWPGSRMVNITAFGGTGPQGSWRRFVTDRMEALVASRPSLDGIMLDNYWERLSWNQSTLQLDSDCNPTHNPDGCNGVADDAARLDSLWNAALRELAADLRQRFDGLESQRARPLALIGNGASDYFPWLNGSIHEAFPSGWSHVDPGNPYRYNWNQEMLDGAAGYLAAPFSADPYAATIMNSVWQGTHLQPDRTPEFERHKRFTLVSTLLGDGFYSLDAGQQEGNGALWWEPEYDHAGRGKGYLGRALGPMRRIGIPSGPELLANGTFAAGTSQWEWYPFDASGSFEVENGSGRITVQSVMSGGELKVWHTQLALQQDGSYRLAFRARADRSMELSFHLYSQGCPGNACTNEETVQLSPSWQEYELLFFAPATASASLNLFVRAPGSVWLDDVSLREGDLSVYRRDFAEGTVLLNYTSSPQTVTLGGAYRRLHLPGSAVFDGATVSVETVPPWDGRILLGTWTAPAPIWGQLHQNEPNPFNPSTDIRFELRLSEHVRLSVLDARGRLVQVLVDRSLPAAEDYRVRWDGTNRLGQPVRSGTYFYRLATPSFVETRKMTLLR